MKQKYIMMSDGKSPHTLKWVKELVKYFELYLISLNGYDKQLLQYIPKDKIYVVNENVNVNGGNFKLLLKYFEIKKKTQDKEERTKDKANEAIKQAEDQARKALLKTRNEQKLKTTRKLNWFEKYDWFISSENYLIISGRDSQQNEEVVKTYLGKRDVYFHSEMAGSAS